MFDQVNEVAKEGTERWKEIESLSKQLDEQANNGHIILEHIIPTISNLLLLMVEHFRPMNPSKEQIDEATKGITDLLNSLKK